MAGHARYTALLDACVLYPLAMADALMSLATTGLFAAKWTTSIEAEWIRSLEENRPDLKGRLHSRRDQMREAVPDWEVDWKWTNALGRSARAAWSCPIPMTFTCWQPRWPASLTVSSRPTSRTFPVEVIAPLGIEVIHPDQFIVAQWGSRPACRRCRLQANAGAVEETSSQRRGFCCRDGAWRTAGHSTATARGR